MQFDHENSSTQRITIEDVDHFPNKEKGMFGEFLSGIYLKSQIRQTPSLLADTEIENADTRIWISHVKGPSVVQRLCFLDEDNDKEVSWEPDFSFEATLPDYDVRRRIFIEAKTGSSKLKGDQRRAIQLAAEQKTPKRTTGLSQPTNPDKRLVYFCQLQLERTAIELTYNRVSPDH
jgi:hypothetical protein